MTEGMHMGYVEKECYVKNMIFLYVVRFKILYFMNFIYLYSLIL